MNRAVNYALAFLGYLWIGIFICALALALTSSGCGWLDAQIRPRHNTWRGWNYYHPQAFTVDRVIPLRDTR